MAEDKKFAPMPLHLDDKIMKGVAFIYNFHLQNNDMKKLNDGVRERLQFLEDKEGYTRKEIRFVLLLLALPEIDEVLAKSNILEEAFAAKFHSVH